MKGINFLMIFSKARVRDNFQEQFCRRVIIKSFDPVPIIRELGANSAVQENRNLGEGRRRVAEGRVMNLKILIAHRIQTVSERSEKSGRSPLRDTTINQQEICRVGEGMNDLLVKPKGLNTFKSRHRPDKTFIVNLKLNTESVGE